MGIFLCIFDACGKTASLLTGFLYNLGRIDSGVLTSLFYYAGMSILMESVVGITGVEGTEDGIAKGDKGIRAVLGGTFGALVASSIFCDRISVLTASFTGSGISSVASG